MPVDMPYPFADPVRCEQLDINLLANVGGATVPALAALADIVGDIVGATDVLARLSKERREIVAAHQAQLCAAYQARMRDAIVDEGHAPPGRGLRVRLAWQGSPTLQTTSTNPCLYLPCCRPWQAASHRLVRSAKGPMPSTWQ